MKVLGEPMSDQDLTEMMAEAMFYGGGWPASVTWNQQPDAQPHVLDLEDGATSLSFDCFKHMLTSYWTQGKFSLGKQLGDPPAFAPNSRTAYKVEVKVVPCEHPPETWWRSMWRCCYRKQHAQDLVGLPTPTWMADSESRHVCIACCMHSALISV